MEPLRARLGRRSVDLIDLSTTGARIEHDFPIALGHLRVLEFSCDGEQVAVPALVTRSRLERGASGAFFRSGLRFTSSDQEQLWGLLVSLALDESRRS